jgi:hypothetical protein
MATTSMRRWTSNSKFDPVILEGIFSAQSGESNGLARNE